MYMYIYTYIYIYIYIYIRGRPQPPKEKTMNTATIPFFLEPSCPILLSRFSRTFGFVVIALSVTGESELS